MPFARLHHPLLFPIVLALAPIVGGQTPSSTTGSTPAPSTASVAAATAPATGSYSIEAEIFAYRALRTNAASIGADVFAVLPPPGTSPQPGVVLVPSVSVILPAFQLWRSNMLVIQNFQDQAAAVFNLTPAPDANGTCQIANKKPAAGAKSATSFSAYASGVTEAVGTIQAILSLFASNQSITEFPGTIQDQALISAVARSLRSRKIQILAPDIFSPWEIDIATSGDSPFITQLRGLVVSFSQLQGVYQCDQLVLSAGNQLQQMESTRESDLAKLMNSPLADKDKNALTSEITNLTAQIGYLRRKIGLDTNDLSITNPENEINSDEGILTDSKATPQQKTAAIESVRRNDATLAALENPLIGKASLSAGEAQSLVSGISGYLAGLTGGAVSFTPPTPPVSQGSSAPNSGGSSGTPAPGGSTTGTPGTQSPGTPSSPSSTPSAPSPAGTPGAASPASTPPPIVTILQADGLARKMGVVPNDQRTWNFDAWRILWLKSMESGGSIIMESNILGSHPHFGGGAVSGYALFQLDGMLVCSGNTAAYGGYVKVGDFEDYVATHPEESMLGLSKNCSEETAKP